MGSPEFSVVQPTLSSHVATRSPTASAASQLRSHRGWWAVRSPTRRVLSSAGRAEVAKLSIRWSSSVSWRWRWRRSVEVYDGEGGASWVERSVPWEWRRATICPIPKIGKDLHHIVPPHCPHQPSLETRGAPHPQHANLRDAGTTAHPA